MKPIIKDDNEDVTMETVQEESAIIYLPNGLLSVRLPLITENPEERLIVLRWYVEEGAEVQPDQLIVRIATRYQPFDMPMPPLNGHYRIHRIEKQNKEILKMGDVFVTLQDLNSLNKTTNFSQPAKTNCAA
jgi:hypothetical protein